MATIEKYQTRSGAMLYRVRYRKPDRKQTQKRGFTTKREAEMFAASVEVAKARGEYVAPSAISVGWPSRCAAARSPTRHSRRSPPTT
jgi:hypothetical protein